MNTVDITDFSSRYIFSVIRGFFYNKKYNTIKIYIFFDTILFTKLKTFLPELIALTLNLGLSASAAGSCCIFTLAVRQTPVLASCIEIYYFVIPHLSSLFSSLALVATQRTPLFVAVFIFLFILDGPGVLWYATNVSRIPTRYCNPQTVITYLTDARNYMN